MRTDKITRKEMLMYAIGLVGTNIVMNSSSNYFMVYMTNVALINVAAVSTILALSKVFDGISDLIVGNIIDNTDHPFGKTRIWIIRMVIPFAVATLLLFWMPPGASNLVKYVYIFIVYNIVNTICYTFIGIAQQAQARLLSADHADHNVLGALNATGMNIGGLIVSVLFIKAVGYFSGGGLNSMTQRGFAVTAAIFTAIGTILIIVGVLGVHERVHIVNEPLAGAESGSKKAKVTEFFHHAKLLVSDRNWMIIFSGNLLQFVALVVTGTAGSYYAMYILGDIQLVASISGTMVFPSTVVSLLLPSYIGKANKKRLLILGVSLTICAYAGMAIFGKDPTMLIAFCALKGISDGFYSSAILGLITDTIECLYYKSDVEIAGMANAGITASIKIGIGLASVVIGVVMASAGFDGALAVQPDAALTAIKWLFIGIPLVLAVVRLLMYFFFNAEEELKGFQAKAAE